MESPPCVRFKDQVGSSAGFAPWSPTRLLSNARIDRSPGLRHHLSVIEDIVGSASGNASLADVLRKCLVLAFSLRTVPFQAWVEQELGGYSVETELPTYRAGLSNGIKANVMNSAYRYSNVVVPAAAMPEDVQETLATIDFRQSVGELEEIVRSAHARGDGTVRVNIDAAVWAVVEFENDYNVTDMWKEISIAQIAGVLDAVRNTALRFALEVERLEESIDRPVEARQESITNIFQTLVHGGVVTIAAHADQVTQIGEINVREDDLESLLSGLREIGIGEGDLRELAEAIAEDAGASSGPSAKVWAWLKRTVSNVPGAAGEVGVAATKAVAIAAVLKYFGLS
jgi:hypothetical protein